MGLADIVRLFAVPVFGLIAYRDVKFRRVPDRVWLPLVGLALVTLLYDGFEIISVSRLQQQLFFLRVGIGVVFLGGLSFLLYHIGFIDDTIAKSLGLTAILYPVFPPPTFAGGLIPLVPASHRVLSLSIASNAAIVGVLYPLGYLLWNGLRGRFSWVMFAGRPVDWPDIAERHGRLLESEAGYTLTGLDLAVIKEYLRWRGITVSLIQQQPTEIRRSFDTGREAGHRGDAHSGEPTSDPWGADQFVAEFGDELAITAEELRGGLTLMAESETVWVSANFPFIIPLFVGILLAYTLGDLPTFFLQTVQ